MARSGQILELSSGWKMQDSGTHYKCEMRAVVNSYFLGSISSWVVFPCPEGQCRAPGRVRRRVWRWAPAQRTRCPALPSSSLSTGL